MFKLVVLCAFLAAAVAEPSAILAPLTYSSTYLSPARTTITNQASSVIHPSPLVYSAPWSYATPLAHLIKKRSAVLSSYIAPTTYIAPAPLTTTYAASPLAYTSVSPLLSTYAAPVLTTGAHFIKKRSAPLVVASSYIAPSVYRTAPVLTSYAAPVVSTPYIPAYSHDLVHFIKKRSAPLVVSTYAAPASISHQSRIDVNTSPAVATYSYSTPLTYASPFSFSRLI